MLAEFRFDCNGLIVSGDKVGERGFGDIDERDGVFVGDDAEDRLLLLLCDERAAPFDAEELFRRTLKVSLVFDSERSLVELCEGVRVWERREFEEREDRVEGCRV